MQNETFSLLIFHGSARPEANTAARDFEQRLGKLADCANFGICFLKGVSPELDEALTDVISRGFGAIRLIPLFLLPGTHTSYDIPEAAAKARSRFPEVKIEIIDCLVNVPGFLQLISEQLKEKCQ